MEHRARQPRTSQSDRIAMGVLMIGLGSLLLVGGVLALTGVDVLGAGTVTGVIWTVLGTVFLGVTLVELPKDNAFAGASSDDTDEDGVEMDYDID